MRKDSNGKFKGSCLVEYPTVEIATNVIKGLERLHPAMEYKGII